MKMVVITGAAGFIGSHICETLLKKGYTVLGIDNLNDYYPLPLKEKNLQILSQYPSFTFAKEDIENKEQILSLIKQNKPDILIHCAARAGVRASVENPFIYTTTNIVGTHILLEAVRLHSPNTKIILLSSSSVYGIQESAPFEEHMSPNPQSPYGATKYAMELMAKQYNDFYKLHIAVVRPFSIYGPRGRVDMAPFLVLRAAEKDEVFGQFGTNGDNKRDWTYIDDFVGGIIKILENHPFATYEVFNLGNSQPIGIDDFITTMKKEIKNTIGKEVQIKKLTRGREDVPITFADLTKSASRIQYNPSTSFEEGIKKMLNYYVINRALYLSIFNSI